MMADQQQPPEQIDADTILQSIVETPAGERIRMTCGAADLRSVITDILEYARVHSVEDARVEAIRERRANEYGHSFTGTRGTDAAMADIDYLLSQLSSSGQLTPSSDYREYNQEALNRFRDFKPNWDSCNGLAINQRAIAIAQRLIPVLPDWQIVPRSDGGIQFDGPNGDEIHVEVATKSSERRCGECGHDGGEVMALPDNHCGVVLRDAGGSLVHCGCKCTPRTLGKTKD